MAEANRTALTRRAEKVTACLSSAVIAPLTLGQCPAKIITAAHTAPTMFAMGAMLGPLAAQLKMPRPDGYVVASVSRPFRASTLNLGRFLVQATKHWREVGQSSTMHAPGMQRSLKLA